MQFTFIKRCDQVWPNLSLRSKGLVVVSIPLFAMLFSAVFSYVINREQDQSGDSVQRSLLMRSEIDKILDITLTSETAVRGYLHTGGKEFLELFEKERQALNASFSRLGEISSGRLNRQRRAASVVLSGTKSMEALASSIDHSGRLSFPVSTAESDALMAGAASDVDKFRHDVDQLNAAEKAIRQQHLSDLERIEWQRTFADVGGVFFGLIGGLIAVQLFSNGIVRRIERLRENANRLAEGHPLVELATANDEIGILAQDLEKAGKLLAERSHALEESLGRVELARAEAERANRAKSVFLSRMSHELRTPLNAILGFGQLLELNDLKEENALCVEHILKGGRYLLNLIDEVLDISRVEAGAIVLHIEPLAFDALARECIAFVARMAEARKITCIVETYPFPGPAVLADEQRLRQVLLNLLSNAIKYNREGGKVILSCEALADGQVALKVADTGEGISPEGLAQLFVPFERLGQEVSGVEGTGLGLVVSKNLVEAMSGCLSVESEVGKGTTFAVRLPTAVRAADARAPDAGPHTPSPVKSVTDERVHTLLYIEDNPSNLKVVELAVAKMHPRWRFIAARDGREGLRLVREHRPGVVLLDLEIPAMNGEAVLSAIRDDTSVSDIPVLVLSADATSERRERLIAAGATDYISKPFDIPVLLRSIEAFFPGG